MKMKVFTIFDVKAECYLPPMFMRTRGEFLRTFVDSLRNTESGIGKHPEDYIAWELGEWDDNKATLEMYPNAVSLGKGVEYLVQHDLEDKL